MPVIVHRMFKSKMAEYGLSMQEFLIEIASRCAEDETDVINIAKELKSRKINEVKSSRKITAERNEIYDILEMDDDF